MSVWPAGRIVGRTTLSLQDDSNGLIQVAANHTVVIDTDPMAVAEKYGLATQQMVGGYAIQDVQEFGSYLAQAPTLDAAAKARLEERIISEGSIFKERR